MPSKGNREELVLVIILVELLFVYQVFVTIVQVVEAVAVAVAVAAMASIQRVNSAASELNDFVENEEGKKEYHVSQPTNLLL